jgi:dTDP-4-dehydrorhamnose 3,5-epimerase
MKFTETRFDGVFVIDLERHEDQRGFFARSFCAKEFAACGLPAGFVQCNISYNHRRGALRGMHYQLVPCEEGKLVRATRGWILDVVLDLRPWSTTYCDWLSFNLSDENGRALYIPPGFAHGFQTLTDHTEVFYQMTEFYDPDLARGVRWDDPAFAIEWPIASPMLSERDASFPDFHLP